MPILTLSLLTPYRKLADELDAAITRGDEIGEDTVRDMLPEVREAVETINAALAEVDALLFDGLRDEALGLHDPDLPAVASRLNLHERPQWPDIEAWFVNAGLPEPPRIDSDALTNLEAAHAELDQLKIGLERLRRMALERAPAAHKLTALRKIREFDSTKLVWSRSVAAHEEVRLGELRTDVVRALAAADLEQLAALHAELVDPGWESEVPRDLVMATRGADVAATLRDSLARAEQIAGEIEAGYAAAAAAGTGDWRPLVDLRTHLQQLQPVVEECLSTLQDCRKMMAVTQKLGLDTAWQAIEPRLAQAFDWITRCEALQATHDTFTGECRRLEYLSDHLPASSEQSRWLADLQRSEQEIRRCCQQVPDLVFPELLQERIRTAKQALAGKEILRRRFVLVMAASAVLVVGVIVGLIGWRMAANGRRATALETMKEFVREARLGGHIVRPPVLEVIAAIYGEDLAFSKLFKQFDGYVETEKDRRQSFEIAITEHTNLKENLEKAVADRMGAGDGTWLDAWPAIFFDAASKLADARTIGGLPSKRSGDGDPEKDSSLPSAAKEQLKREEDELARAEAWQEDIDRQFVDMAIKSFTRQRDDLLKRVESLEAEASEEIDAKARATAKKIQREARSLVQTAAYRKQDDQNTNTTPDKDRRVPEAVRQKVDKLIDERLRVFLTGGTSSP